MEAKWKTIKIGFKVTTEEILRKLKSKGVVLSKDALKLFTSVKFKSKGTEPPSSDDDFSPLHNHFD